MLFILISCLVIISVLLVVLLPNQDDDTVTKSDIPKLLDSARNPKKSSSDTAPSPETPVTTGDYDKAKNKQAKDEVVKEDLSSSEEGEKQLRINEQCYLLTWLPELSIQNKTLTGDRTDYENFQIIDGAAYEIISLLSEVKNADHITKITPAQKAVIVAQIQLFKVLTNGKKETVIEFPFASNLDKTSADILTRPNSKKASSSLAGIKEFSLDFLGGTPAEADKYIKAKIILYFQNIASFLENYDNISFTDLVRYAQSDEYNPDVLRIKAVVGWADPNFSHAPMTKEMRNAIKNNKLILDLSLINHELNMNQDGSFTLEVNYIARIEALLSVYDSNILVSEKKNSISPKRAEYLKRALSNLSKQEKLLNSLKTKVLSRDREGANSKQDPQRATNLGIYAQDYSTTVREYNESIKRFEDYTRSQEVAVSGDEGLNYFTGQKEFSTTPPGDTGDTVEASLQKSGIDSRLTEVKKKQQALESARNRLQDAEKNLRVESYRKLMQRIEVIGMYYVDVSQEDIGIFQSDPTTKKVEINPDEPAFSKKSQATPPKAKLWLSPKQAKTTETTAAGVNTAGGIGAYTGVDVKSGNYRIFYFYLGALLDSALQALKGNIGEEKFKEIKYIVGNITIKSGNNQARYINLADMPISLQRFLVWFNEHVVKKERDRYPFKEFIQDVILDLVISALGDGCYEMIKQDGKVMAIPFSVPYADQSGLVSRTGPQRVTSAAEIKTARLQANEPEGLAEHKLENFFLIVGTNSEIDSKLQYNSKSHFLTLGEDRGIVKSIKFTKQDLRFYKSHKVADHAEKDKINGFVREPYNAEISMIGNSLFLPGQTANINNFLPGGMDGNIVGLGGNYLITNVKHVFSRDGWETTAQSRWQNDGVSSIAFVSSEPVEASPQKETPISEGNSPGISNTHSISSFSTMKTVKGLLGIDK